MPRLLFLFAVVLIAPLPSQAQVLITQNFDTDPGWSTAGSGANSNSFGYSATAYAGGNPGEAGGRFTRSHFARYYGDDLGGTLTLATPFQGSGLLNITGANLPDLGPGLVVGHYDPNSLGSVGLVFNNTPQNGVYCDAIVRFTDGTSIQSTVPIAQNIALDVARTWSYSWNPTGGTMGAGRLTIALGGTDGGTGVLDLTPDQQAMALQMTAFGLFGGSTSDTAMNQSQPTWYIDGFIDNVAFTAVPEPGSFALCAAGAGAVGFVRRWRRRSNNASL